MSEFRACYPTTININCLLCRTWAAVRGGPAAAEEGEGQDHGEQGAQEGPGGVQRQPSGLGKHVQTIVGYFFVKFIGGKKLFTKFQRENILRLFWHEKRFGFPIQLS